MQSGKIISSSGTEIRYSFSSGSEDTAGIGGGIGTAHPGGTATGEYHLMLTPSVGTSAGRQFREIEEALEEFIATRGMIFPLVVFQRFFSSDVSNHAPLLRPVRTGKGGSSVSLVQQPPASGNKLMAWVYLIDFRQKAPETLNEKHTFSLTHNGYRHLYTSGMTSPSQQGSYDQTAAIFGEYIRDLQKKGLTLAGNCIRTWIFVRDIDNNYGGMVSARNAIFDREGLTPATRFITSTGIEGQTEKTNTLVAMDAYAIGGITPAQVRHLNALTHLSPTHDYGVAFERGTAVDYGDRRHILISGTASIDHKGKIVHPGDIARQTERTFENIGALLAEGDATFANISSMIVYLRDLADTRFITAWLQERFPDIPTVVAIAPVCRPGWLVEVECTAAIAVSNPQFRNF